MYIIYQMYCSCATKAFFSSILFIGAFTIIGIPGEVHAATRPPEVVKPDQCGDCEEASRSDIAKTCYGMQTYWCCECPAGRYLAKNCRVHEPLSTECTTCPFGTFTSESNHLVSCIESKTSCIHLPYTRFERGNSAEDNKCLCVDGTYSSNPDISGCKKHNECPKGFGVKTLGNSTYDSECEKCEKEMCADEESSTQRCYKCVDVSSNGTISAPELTTARPTTVQVTEQPTECPVVAEPLCNNQVMWVLIFLVVFLSGALCLCVMFIYCERKKRKEATKSNDINQSPNQNSGDDSSIAEPLLPGHNDEGYRGERMQEFEETSLTAPLKTVDREEEPEEISSSDPESEKEFKKLVTPNAGDEQSEQKSPSDLKSQDCSSSLDSVNTNFSSHVAITMPGGEDEEKKDGDESTEEEKTRHVESPLVLNEAEAFEPKEPDLKCKATNLIEDEFTDIFSGRGYSVTYNPKSDGHCQFAAMVHQMNPGMQGVEVQEQAVFMRHEIVKYMEEHKNDFKGFNVGGDWPTYIEEMSKNKYGEHTTLQAACDKHRISFKIIQTSNQNDEEVMITPREQTEEEKPKDPLLLGHIGEDQGMHYVCLAPKSSADAKTPISDSRVGENSQQIPRPSNLNIQANSEGSVIGQSREDPVQNAQSGPAPRIFPVTNGPSLGSSVSSDVGSDMNLFDNESDQAILSQIPPDELHDALESADYLHEMLPGPSGLHKSTSSSDLIFFIRQKRLLGDGDVAVGDIAIADIKGENSVDQKELRRKLAKEVVVSQGRKLTPRKLLKMSLEYKERHIYDELCKAFIGHLDNSRTAA